MRAVAAPRPRGELVQRTQNFRCAPSSASRAVSEFDDDADFGEGVDVASRISGRDPESTFEQSHVDYGVLDE